MSGHSKWNNIKNKKAVEDRKKGKMFGEVARMIRVAAKQGKSGDPGMNPALRLALDKARIANMPKENIQRAIDKGMGKSSSGAAFDEVVYEGFGPEGVGIMIWCITDNRNRTGSEVRSLIERAGGSLGGPGSSAYLFSIHPEGSADVIVPMPINDSQIQEQIESLTESLEERDDVEMVVTNMVKA